MVPREMVVKLNNVPFTIEQARAARERARELARKSRALIQNSNALLDQADAGPLAGLGQAMRDSCAIEPMFGNSLDSRADSRAQD